MANKKANKKAKTDSAKPAKAQVKKLRAELANAESERDKWKKRAVDAEAAVSDLQARLKVTEKRLKKARKADVDAKPASPRAPSPASAPPSAGESPGTDGALDAVTPDASWTVTELRAEALRRGIGGMSRKPKAELLAALS